MPSLTKGGILAPAPLKSKPYAPYRFPHSLVLIKKANDSTLDDYGQPTVIVTGPTETIFSGYLVQHSSTKIHQANQAGRSIGTHFLKAPPSLAITKNDVIRWNVGGDARRYEVNGDPSPAGGRGHHLAVDLQLVTA